MKSSCVGKKYGKLTVIEAIWPKLQCICDCGNEKAVLANALYGGNTKSCGCIRNTAKGLTTKYRREYQSWYGAIRRCTNENNQDYFRYGARGITVCERWLNSFPAFLEDMGPKTKNNYTIDRIDNNGNYEPDNCQWGTRERQANNTRQNALIKHMGEIKTMAEWGKKYNISLGTLHYRLRKLKWNIKKALNTPVRAWKKKGSS